MDFRATDNQLIIQLFNKREIMFKYVHIQHQNELINVMACKRVHEAGIFALIADEMQDISMHEQVAMVLRSVDRDLAGCPESFIGFYT